METWGLHLLVDAQGGNLSVSKEDEIRFFVTELVQAIDMVAYGEPQIQKFGEGNKAGYTLVQLIETSNITGHFCDETGDFYLDVFSCKSYDPRVVLELVDKYFGPRRIVSRVVPRGDWKNAFDLDMANSTSETTQAFIDEQYSVKGR